MPLTRSRAGLLVALLAVAAARCGGAGQQSNDTQIMTAPDPATSQLNAAWTGSITRPNGLGTIAIQWAATQDSSGKLTGPFAMTLNGITLAASFSGVFTSASTPAAGVVSFSL
jgi:hypothetical protein